ncbi:MAG: methyltransferase domain-containing protein [Chlorogloeopsis fritschii C42_A2020_084]|uniref:class I SAM-dependent methyltransferase n=1 Tax=Chlorogloeopsis fritschii TaxID=1124 RepID=UPI0019EFAD34|nr:methyltransferase domain-containing protein [Chlorogloeopsis fritschii]MBF2004227.1 methyltransferase domain-containing protein [Chlorogloeopsis fritschii C42_A2020_084]
MFTQINQPKSIQFKSDRVLLNLGCGHIRPIGWINTDSSLNAFLQKFPFLQIVLKKYSNLVIYESQNVTYMDLRKRWKFTSNSVDVVYTSHLFEHLSLIHTELFLREAYRVLKPKGVIRIVVPDLCQLAKQYIEAYEQNKEDASNTFLYCLNLHKEGFYPSNRRFAKRVIDWMQGYPHQHKYMYDYLSLKKIMQSAGFINQNESSYGESKYIPEIKQVEYTGEGMPSIYIESTKPN